MTISMTRGAARLAMSAAVIAVLASCGVRVAPIGTGGGASAVAPIPATDPGTRFF